MESVRDGRIHKSQRSAIGTKDEEARKRDAIARLVASEASQASIEPPTERPFAGVTVHVNRSPVMILWAACLASRLGHEWPACLSLGSAVAAMNARSKGCRLGIYEDDERETPGDANSVLLLGRKVPILRTDVTRACASLGSKNTIAPIAVHRQLETAFGDMFGTVYSAMKTLATAIAQEDCAGDFPYRLYKEWRPTIPDGRRGWGAPGPLRLDLLSECCNRVTHANRSVPQLEVKEMSGETLRGAILTVLRGNGGVTSEELASRLSIPSAQPLMQSSLEELQLDGSIYMQQEQYYLL